MIATDVRARNALWLPMLIASSSDREEADDDRRDDRHLAAARHAGDLRAEGQAAVAGHGEHHADARRVHGQAADGDRDGRVDEEDVADGVPQCLLDDVGQAQQRDVLVVDVVDRHQGEEDHQPADHRRRGEGLDDRRRRVAARVVGLLGQRPRGVEPVHDVRAHDPADDEGAEVAPLVALAEAQGVEHDAGAAAEVDGQQDDQQRRADELEDDPDVVDPCHQLDADHVHDGREDDEDRAEQDRVLGPARGQVGPRVGLVAEDLEGRRDLRQDHLPRDGHRRHRHDRADDHDPARHPRREVAADALGPLIHGAGQRILARELREAQRDGHLPDEDDRPGPPHRRSAEGEPEGEQLEDAGQDRDVAEARRERREAPQRPIEFLLVAEARKLVAVRCLYRHVPSSSRRRAPVGRSPASPPSSLVADGCCARLDRQLIYQSSVGVKAPAGGTPTLLENPSGGRMSAAESSQPPARRCSWTGRGDPAARARPTRPRARPPARSSAPSRRAIATTRRRAVEAAGRAADGVGGPDRLRPRGAHASRSATPSRRRRDELARTLTLDQGKPLARRPTARSRSSSTTGAMAAEDAKRLAG